MSEEGQTRSEVSIEQLPEAVKVRFTEGSRVKEAESVMASMRVLNPDEAQRVEATKIHRIIGSRWLDVWKKHDGDYDNRMDQSTIDSLGITRHMDAKSRLVLKGYTDPDSSKLQTATPTPETVDINL
eukprot:5356482-Amphidinium_carterae.1